MYQECSKRVKTVTESPIFYDKTEKYKPVYVSKQQYSDKHYLGITLSKRYNNIP